MKIWIDGDACPNPVKDIVYRAAGRVPIDVIIVANKYLRTPASKHVKAVQVAGGIDAADNHIVQHAAAGDVVVTADIPLAASLLENGVHVLNPRGTRYTRDNIREKLVMRDFMEEMRGSGLVHGGPAPFGQKDKQTFANALDRMLTRLRQ